MKKNNPRRVVITTASLISPVGSFFGNSLQTFKPRPAHTQMITTDKNTLKIPIRQIETFNLNNFIGHNKNKRSLHRAAQLTAAAAISCIEKASLSEEEKSNCAIIVGTGPYLEKEPQNLSERKALWLLQHLPNTAASFISLTAKIKGESITMGTACAASLQAIGTAYRFIKTDYWQRALVGGGDSRINSVALNGYYRTGALYTQQDKGDSYNPLGSTSTGFIAGEGSAFFLLEEYSNAKKRGAPILAEIIGFGSTVDSYNMTAPCPTGESQKKAIQIAIKDAKLSIKDIDRISAHGTGTLLNDNMETKILKDLFKIRPNQKILKNSRPTIVAHKRELGHLASACGAAELALEPSLFQNKKQKILLQNFGFGGQNSALIIQTGKKNEF